MKRYTSGYTQSHRQFVIQNLPPRMASRYSPILKVVLNILQRGSPTAISPTLAAALGIDSTESLHRLPERILPDSPPSWRYTIRGDAIAGRNPARRFFHDLIPEEVGPSANWLLQPEVAISELVQRELADLTGQQVDFYVPDAKAIIEIDGAQHQDSKQGSRDTLRNRRLHEHGIETIRVPTAEIGGGDGGSSNLQLAMDTIRGVYTNYSSFNDLTEEDWYALGAVAAFRLQVTVLELLLCGRLALDGSPWCLFVECDDADRFAEPAIDDLLGLIAEIANVYQIEWTPPRTIETDISRPGACIHIDLSCIRRWTDANQDHIDKIYVRSDYVYEYPDEHGTWRPLDHYRVESDESILTTILDDRDDDPLRPLLSRLFGYSEFRTGQRPVIANALAHRKTVGILPTGQGKSLCYQLAALLQPGVTVVISPLRSLMRDQVAELQQMGIDRVAGISSEDSPAEKRLKMNRFAAGAYQILLVSPERFQVPVFRDVCQALTQHRQVHQTVVDEVHCLSEWGHDFRIAYLNLANTLSKTFPNARFIGLTATASANVITDIRNEFDVPEEDVIYRLDLRRTNLDFQVAKAQGSHADAISKWIQGRIGHAANDPPTGIIFTPHVNGKRGCYSLAAKLTADLKIHVGTFSGSRPKQYPGNEAEFEKDKLLTQDQFKDGTIRVLCATKAFGMGVNKKNVRFTAHLGVPSSMESLYQEAGRAGRDGDHADCLVFASQPSEKLHRAFELNITPVELRQLIESVKEDSDLKAQLWLLTKDLKSINEEFHLTKAVLHRLRSGPTTEIHSAQIEINGARDSKPFAVQHAIYRLAQLGYVTDWTVLNFFRGIYSVDFVDIDSAMVESNLLRLVRSYSGQSAVKTLEDIFEGDALCLNTIFKQPPRPPEDIAILLLLTWSFNHFHHARRQSMKTVFELCDSYEELGKQQFRERLEAFFQIDSRTNTLHRLIDGGIALIEEWPTLILGEFGAGGLSIDDQGWRTHLDQLQGMINRLLESFRGNVALDMLSAMVRLLRGQYTDVDGRGRLTSQLGRTQLSSDDCDKLIDFSLAVGRLADPNQKELLSQDLLERRPDRDTALAVHEALDDQHSLITYLGFLTEILASINQGFQDGLAPR